MTARVWDPFLTPRDRAHAERTMPAPWGFGSSPALLLVDLYRGAFGDRPHDLLDAVDEWPQSCGMAGWEALPAIQRLLDTARDLRIPVIHTTGSTEVPGWHFRRPETSADTAWRHKAYEIIGPVAPRAGEVVIRKAAPSPFWGTPLVGALTQLGVDTLVVAGETTSGCVRATVTDGRTHRYRMIVPEECVFDRTESAHALSLFDMHMKFADVVALEEVLHELRACARRDA